MTPITTTPDTVEAGYNGMVEAALDELLHGQPARMVAEVPARIALERLAHKVRQVAERQALRELCTSEEAATQLGVARRTVQKLAALLEIGWATGNDGVGRPRDLLFQPGDVARLRQALATRKPGRPPRAQQQAPIAEQ